MGANVVGMSWDILDRMERAVAKVRERLLHATAALNQAGFVGGELLDVAIFRDGPDGKPSEAVHLLFAGEKTRPDHLLPAPEFETVLNPANFRVITLDKLVVMKLLSNRDKDRTHLRNLVGVGLIDPSWLNRLPPVLFERWQHILDTPDG